MSNTQVAWIEIPVSNLEKGIAFYNAVFGWSASVTTEMGPDPLAVFGSGDDACGGHLYAGKPAAGVGPTVHLTLTDTVEEGAARVTENGGEVMGPIIEIPAGRFQYATDPDGNSIGLFQAVAA